MASASIRSHSRHTKSINPSGKGYFPTVRPTSCPADTPPLIIPTDGSSHDDESHNVSELPANFKSMIETLGLETPQAVHDFLTDLSTEERDEILNGMRINAQQAKHVLPPAVYQIVKQKKLFANGKTLSMPEIVAELEAFEVTDDKVAEKSRYNKDKQAMEYLTSVDGSICVAIWPPMPAEPSFVDLAERASRLFALLHVESRFQRMYQQFFGTMFTNGLTQSEATRHRQCIGLLKHQAKAMTDSALTQIPRNEEQACVFGMRKLIAEQVRNWITLVNVYYGELNPRQDLVYDFHGITFFACSLLKSLFPRPGCWEPEEGDFFLNHVERAHQRIRDHVWVSVLPLMNRPGSVALPKMEVFIPAGMLVDKAVNLRHQILDFLETNKKENNQAFHEAINIGWTEMEQCVLDMDRESINQNDEQLTGVSAADELMTLEDMVVMIAKLIDAVDKDDNPLATHFRQPFQF